MTHVRVAMCCSWHVSVATQLPALTDSINVPPVMTTTHALIQIVGNAGSWTCSDVGDASFDLELPKQQLDQRRGKLRSSHL